MFAKIHQIFFKYESYILEFLCKIWCGGAVNAAAWLRR